MNAISYKQLRAFAAQYGAVVGLMWIVSFAFLYYRADPSARRQRGSHHRIVVRGNSRFPDTEIQR